MATKRGRIVSEGDALKRRCRSIHRALELFASPWVVEFAGLPRAGKSECISTVEHFLQQNKFRVFSPSEGAGQAPEYLKGNLLSYNTWTATYAIHHILEASSFVIPVRERDGKSGRVVRRYERYYDIVLLDRGLFDATAWVHLLESDRKLPRETRDIITRFLRVDEWRERVQQVFLFTCSRKTSLAREFRFKLIRKGGVTTGRGFLRRLQRAYDDAENCYEDAFDVVRINTDNKSHKRVAGLIVRHMFDAITSAARTARTATPQKR